MGVTVFSPAKINLFLAVTGRRSDGFHDLVSVVAPLDFGDELEARRVPKRDGESRFSLTCTDPALAVDRTNLVLRAAEAFAAATGWAEAVEFHLHKRIPVGAGLGGGSSNGAAALRALNELSGGLARADQMTALAVGLGSDCPLFLRDGPVVMRGRGERVDDLPESALRRLRGQPVLLFKPSFGVPTVWAYARMAARGTDYVAPAEAEAKLRTWIAGEAPAAKLLLNNFEGPVFEKYVALPALLEPWRREGRTVILTGSGSACVALTSDDPVTPLIDRIRAAWGEAAFVQSACIR
ncbi:MAG TPA: 4-(cytidine 5'-diphospho)-2-C-methyl-D-erythritol kinase [Candidatus Didemnitutus sp.]|nr:4-(cytidine 5'-diphospho)-2-C-methyl-D-erythritol kinase [Candidatus Didemnitutus sp.]